MAYKPISQYGLIGDMNSAALVGTDGSIDWCCFPRFDSPSVFAAILDDRNGGRFQIAPTNTIRVVEQTYLPNTNILSTKFKTDSGDASVIDFMPLSDGGSSAPCPHEIHRIVKCTRGSVELRSTCQPRLDYARGRTILAPINGGVIAHGRHHALSICSTVPLEIVGSDASANFTLRDGEEVVFVLAYGNGRSQRVETYQTAHKFELTKMYWENVASRITYDEMWKEEVVRSLLVLQLLVYSPTGAMVAAPTTSLPERISGSRNWDYRYSWLRDSSFAMDVLYRMGQSEETTQYLKWLVHQNRVTTGRTRIVYGISSSSSLKESVLDHLEGYRSSRPVRIGNRASQHIQMDGFGEVILGIETLHRNGAMISDDTWSLVEDFAEVVCGNWHRKDRGLWEVRGAKQHFVYSKVMCWTALDRAEVLAKALGRNADTRWRKVADAIKEEVLERGWSSRKQAFVQRYNSDTLDASNLMMPFVGFLPPNHPQVLSTIDAINRELAEGPLVKRYIPEETDDGLSGEHESPFTLLSFWLIGNLILTGRIEEARNYFERLLGYANHLGLFAEMIDPRTKELLGNFPQAYSHIGLIHTARNLSRVLS